LDGTRPDSVDVEARQDAELAAILAGVDSQSSSEEEDENEVAERMQRELQDDEANVEAYRRFQAKKKRMEEFGVSLWAQIQSIGSAQLSGLLMRVWSKPLPSSTL
jgi:hypothetical protein